MNHQTDLWAARNSEGRSVSHHVKRPEVSAARPVVGTLSQVSVQDVQGDVLGSATLRAVRAAEAVAVRGCGPSGVITGVVKDIRTFRRDTASRPTAGAGWVDLPDRPDVTAVAGGADGDQGDVQVGGVRAARDVLGSSSASLHFFI